jgi:hypothetical protein
VVVVALALAVLPAVVALLLPVLPVVAVQPELLTEAMARASLLHQVQ